MTIYDFIILLFLFLFMLVGFSRGITRTITETIALVCCILVAIWSAPHAAKIVPLEASELTRMIIAGFVCGFVTLVFINIMFLHFRANTIKGSLKFFDKFLGALFGLVKGVVFVVMLVMVLSLTPFSKTLSQTIHKSGAIPLQVTVAIAKPLARWAGGRFVSALGNQIAKALPEPVGNIPTKKMGVLVEKIKQLKEHGRNDRQIVSQITHDALRDEGHFSPAAKPEVVEELVEKTGLLLGDSLSTEQITHALTTDSINISSTTMSEVIRVLQTMQAAGEPVDKDAVLNKLSRSSRAEVETALYTLKVRKLEPAKFAAATGFDLEQLAEQYGLEKVFYEYEQMEPPSDSLSH